MYQNLVPSDSKTRLGLWHSNFSLWRGLSNQVPHTTLFQVMATPVSVFMVLTFQLMERSPSQTPSFRAKNQYSTSKIHTCLCTTLVGEMGWLKYIKTRRDEIVEEEKVTVLQLMNFKRVVKALLYNTKK